MRQKTLEKSKDKKGGGKVIFLIGAGCSIPCGIPGMDRFLDSFLKNVELKECEKSLFDILCRYTGRNLELFLEKLSKITNVAKDTDIQELNFLKGKKMDLKAYISLEEKLLNYIFTRCINFNRGGAIDAYSNLLGLMDILKLSQMHIFSLNYDICIEEVCEIKKRENQKWKVSTGFSTRGFEEEFNNPICLYKLHGSTTWFEEEEGIREVFAKKILSEITKIDIRPMMIYPTNKYDIAKEIPAKLFNIFRKKLEKSEICIAIGYSFGDLHIVSEISNAILNNKNLILMVVSPNASEICDRMLSSHENRVLAVDDVMENVKKLFSISCIQDIIETFKKIEEAGELGESEKKREVFAEIAETFARNGLYNGALKYGKVAFNMGHKDIGETIGYWSYVLAKKYMILSKPEESRQVFQEALKYYMKIDNPSTSSIILIAKIYEELDMPKKAKEMYEKALEILKIEDKRAIIEEIESKMGNLKEDINKKNLNERLKKGQVSEKFSKVEIGKGNRYLVRDLDDAYFFLSGNLEEFKVLCVSAEPEAIVTSRYNLKNVSFFEIGSEELVNSQKENSQQEIFGKITNFAEKENGNGIILIDCISSFFVYSSDEKNIYNFFYELNDFVRSMNSTLIGVIQDESVLPGTFRSFSKDFIIIENEN